MIIAGPSGSGKTMWIYQFLRYHAKIMNVTPSKIIYYYSVWQPIYDKLQDDNLISEFRNKFPSTNEIEELNTYSSVGGSLVIIDDQALEVNKEAAKIFTVTGRHSSVSIIFITQNLFMQQPFYRDISLQTTYFILLKNPRDKSAIKHLAQQIYPTNTGFVYAVAEHALQEPFSYLLIDLHQEIDEKLRFRTNIFPHEFPITVYVPSMYK